MAFRPRLARVPAGLGDRDLFGDLVQAGGNALCPRTSDATRAVPVSLNAGTGHHVVCRSWRRL